MRTAWVWDVPGVTALAVTVRADQAIRSTYLLFGRFSLHELFSLFTNEKVQLRAGNVIAPHTGPV